MRLLTDYLCIECAVDDYCFSDLLGFVGLQEIAASFGKFLFDCLIYAVQNDDRLLGCADHTVVEGLRVDDGVDGKSYVCGVVDDCGCVACADAESGLAG